MPVHYVKPFTKRGKSDAIDGEAICEAVIHRKMRSIAIKTIEQQAFATLLRVRDLSVSQRVRAISALRGHMAEFGIVAPKGATKIDTLIHGLEDIDDRRIPEVGRSVLGDLYEAIRTLTTNIDKIDAKIAFHSKQDADYQQLKSIPGIGTTIAAVINAHVSDVNIFVSARHFSSWIDLIPRIQGSGGKIRQGHISRAGNKILRSLLFLGQRLS